MMRTRHFRQSVLLCLLILLLLVSLSTPAYTENIDPDNDGSQYAYGENTGWIDLEPDASVASGVEVGDASLTGYMWGENIGWISLRPSGYGGVVNDGQGNLSGYAWGENVGWINFAPDNGGVTIDPETGVFDGCAWGENVGWICFKSTGTVNYGVVTSWRAANSQTGGDTGTDDDGTSDSVTSSGSNNGGGCFISSATGETPSPASAAAFLLLPALLPLILNMKKTQSLADQSTRRNKA